MKLRSHFTFSKQERSGILLLVSLIVGVMAAYYFLETSEKTHLDVSSAEILQLQKELDSLRTVELERRKPKLYPFNPNFITDHKAYLLGMTPQEFDRLKLFREKDQWINSATDFQRVTKVSDSLLDVIQPYFKFPDWVTNPKSASKKKAAYNTPKPFAQKVDLNEASAAQLQEVYGIGEALSKRIISYREKLGGFADDIELHNVYGLDSMVIKRVLDQFTVKSPRLVTKMDLNTASASDIATIPGISFELAKRIWEYRKLRERISDFSELEKIEGLSVHKLQLIQLYLSVD
ncbi:helix-hairpin-helix domain-containing protein [Altibacter sp.]|uniref:ComEA family DNA-binding protein n=1 Tax=Altibacter sp. TaxID=2024823 RepID=UPI000C904175|nr:helix-hairpin-helix domain-containing protein [Altibacter sp.]MAP54569.1 competence protein ComEA [Altibacter sp.]